MGKLVKLADLREENRGYNPEEIEGHENLKVVRLQPRHAILRNEKTEREEVWTLAEVASEAEYIREYPKTFGLVIDGCYYYKAS